MGSLQSSIPPVIRLHAYVVRECSCEFRLGFINMRLGEQ